MLDIYPLHVLFVIGCVLLMLFVLDKIYYKPIGTILGERESKIERETAQIEALTEEIREKTDHIETVLKDAKRDSAKIKEALIKKGENVRETVINDARENAKKMFDDKMKKLDTEIADAEKQLETEIEVFSEKIKEVFV